MPIDFHHLPVIQTPGTSISIEDLLHTIADLPGGDRGQFARLKERGIEIEADARGLGRAVLKILAADLDTVEAENSLNPSKLRTEVLSRIEQSLLTKLRAEDSLKIGAAIGIDRDRFSDFNGFIKGLSQEVFDRLFKPEHISDCLDLLTANQFLKLLDKPESGLFNRLSDLLSETLTALAELGSILDLSTPAPFRPLPTSNRRNFEPFIPALVQAYFLHRQEETSVLRDEKKPSLFDALIAACKNLGEAADYQHHKQQEQQVKDQEESREVIAKSIEEFTEQNPQLRELLESIVRDRHFTDNPLTQGAKLAALEQAEKIKLG